MAIAMHVWFFAGYIGVGGTFPKPLSAKEEEEYLQKMAEGDLEAKNVLIERNLRLVAHVVKKYSPLGKDNEDLISIGTIGLIKGVTSFKAGKGTRLATYVARCIDNEILMHIRSSKKLQNEVSIHDTIGVDREGNEITLLDIVEDEREEVSEQVNSKMQVANLYDKMKQVLAGRAVSYTHLDVYKRQAVNLGAVMYKMNDLGSCFLFGIPLVIFLNQLLRRGGKPAVPGNDILAF